MTLCDFCYRSKTNRFSVTFAVEGTDCSPIRLDLCDDCMGRLSSGIKETIESSKKKSVRQLKDDAGLTPDQAAKVSAFLQYNGLPT